MAGLWDRIIPGTDRVPVHLLKAAMYLSATGVFTSQQLESGINSTIDIPLDAAAVADLGAVRSAIMAASAVNKVTILERFDALNIGVEAGVMTNEATYRAQLGI